MQFHFDSILRRQFNFIKKHKDIVKILNKAPEEIRSVIKNKAQKEVCFNYGVFDRCTSKMLSCNGCDSYKPRTD